MQKSIKACPLSTHDACRVSLDGLHDKVSINVEKCHPLDVVYEIAINSTATAKNEDFSRLLFM